LFRTGKFGKYITTEPVAGIVKLTESAPIRLVALSFGMLAVVRVVFVGWIVKPVPVV
jgi:hypothetical protein